MLHLCVSICDAAPGSRFDFWTYESEDFILFKYSKNYPNGSADENHYYKEKTLFLCEIMGHILPQCMIIGIPVDTDWLQSSIWCIKIHMEENNMFSY